MASRKNLKKDIDRIIDDLVTDCYICMYEHPDLDMSGFETIINEAMFLRDDLINRINHAGEGGEEIKKNFQTIKADLSANIANQYVKLESLIG